MLPKISLSGTRTHASIFHVSSRRSHRWDLSIAEITWGTASNLLTSSSSHQPVAEQDVTDADVSSTLDIMAADVPCSPPSNNQARKKQPANSDDNRPPPNAQEQRQQPHQISNPDNTENNPSAHEYTDLDNFGLCNPLLVGISRKFLVWNSGRVRDFMGAIDSVSNTMRA